MGPRELAAGAPLHRNNVHIFMCRPIWYKDDCMRGFAFSFSIPTLPNVKVIFYGSSNIFFSFRF